MKHIFWIISVVGCQMLYAQTACTYQVIRTNNFPKLGLPPQIEIEMNVHADANHSLVETRFKKDEHVNYVYSGDIKASLFDRDKGMTYGFGEDAVILECYYLAWDTLVSTGKKASYGGYNCDIYTVKHKPQVKVYACKKLATEINPGIGYVYEKSIGGIARIEITKEEFSLVFQLVKILDGGTKLETYIKKAREYTTEPTEARSILGN